MVKGIGFVVTILETCGVIQPLKGPKVVLMLTESKSRQ